MERKAERIRQRQAKKQELEKIRLDVRNFQAQEKKLAADKKKFEKQVLEDRLQQKADFEQLLKEKKAQDKQDEIRDLRNISRLEKKKRDKELRDQQKKRDEWNAQNAANERLVLRASVRSRRYAGPLQLV